MRAIYKLVAVPLIATLTACAAYTEFSPTGDRVAESKPENCDFFVYSTPPQRKYFEIGILDIKPMECITCPNTASNVKKIAAKDVCNAGGDAVLLWEANGWGMYLKATVIKFED
ncbi:MAG: hypothetical protein H7A08_03795 [Oceanospirillaceae bacterium]|nr:hypothetical protein [Oceanospirillaceae bacterium]